LKRNQTPIHFLILWIAGFLFLVLAFIPQLGDAAIDLQLHDTYLVIATSQIFIAFSILFFLLGLIYYFCRKHQLVKWLSHLHVFISVSYILILSFINFYQIKNTPPRNYSFEEYTTTYISFDKVIFIGALVFFIAQIIFICNVVFSIIRNRKNAIANLNSKLLDDAHNAI